MNETDNKLSSAQLNRMMILLGVIVATMFLISGYAWLALPDNIQIPVHWGVEGKPDRYGDKLEGLFLLPCIALAACVLLRAIPLIEPRRSNLLRSIKAYRIVGLCICGVFLSLHTIMVGSVLGLLEFNVTSATAMLLSIVFVVIGNYLGKVRSNFVLGIRTPWTLSSNLAWDKTHRLGGRLFIVAGLIGLLSLVVDPDLSITVVVAAILSAALISIVYSYFAWRSDPDKTSE